ncbi:MAG: hypothetical protein QOJ64_1201 [Acidobacteriota bacterium]|nr:hypothetical protein [Acidobacteriota bacterium]
MTSRHSDRILPLIILIVLFGFGCSSVKQSNSEGSPSPARAKTKITPETLKARLSGKKVTFLEEQVGEQPSVTAGIDIGMPTLKIVSGETPPKVDFNREVVDFFQMVEKLRYRFQSLPREDRDRSVRLAASEPDIAFYNERGISVEDFEMLIGNLGDEVNHFEIDLIGIKIPEKTPPHSGPPPSIRPVSPREIEAPTSIRPVGPRESEPPLRKTPTSP